MNLSERVEESSLYYSSLYVWDFPTSNAGKEEPDGEFLRKGLGVSGTLRVPI